MKDRQRLLTASGRPAVPVFLKGSRVQRAFVTPAETVHAVRDVTFSAHAGEFVCIHGASGSGKSTLLNLLAGLDVADGGTIHVAGTDVGALNEGGRARLRLETIGVVFQDHQLIDEFTAWENVALPLKVRGVAGKQAKAEALAELEQVGLSSRQIRASDRVAL